MIIDVGAKVRALVTDGATYDEVLAAGPTAGVRGQVGRPAALPDGGLRGTGAPLTGALGVRAVAYCRIPHRTAQTPGRGLTGALGVCVWRAADGRAL